MRVVTGEGGSLYAAGAPFRFTCLPLTDSGDGFTWRSTDATLRSWIDGPGFLFEHYDGSGWVQVEPVEVDHAAGSVMFGRCLTGHVRVTGVGVPTTLVAESEGWALSQEVIQSETLTGRNVIEGATTAVLRGIRDLAGVDSVRRVLAVLPSGATGAFVGLGQAVRDAAGLKVIFDNKGVTYVC